MLPHEVWAGTTAQAKALRALATPASWLYAFGWQCYLATYGLGFKRAKSPHKPVMCVGNLVVGGSGKSPVTMHIAKVLLEMGRSVVIGCSGYGSPHAEAAALAPDGPLLATEWGDEPAMIRWLMPEVPIVVGRRRVLAAELVHEHYPDAVLLMDDGFQHLPLAKQLTIVLDEASPRNMRCLPAGPYREPRGNRSRADALVPGAMTVNRQSMRIQSPEGKDQRPAIYGILCALGDPSRFLATLADEFPNAIENPSVKTLLDHDPLTAANLWDGLPSDVPIVVTAKDWVKLRERADIAEREILIALQDVELSPRRELVALINKKLS
jgi:tetraacyldisaccharide 4'-kinase